MAYFLFDRVPCETKGLGRGGGGGTIIISPATVLVWLGRDRKRGGGKLKAQEAHREGAFDATDLAKMRSCQ